MAAAALSSLTTTEDLNCLGTFLGAIPHMVLVSATCIGGCCFVADAD